MPRNHASGLFLLLMLAAVIAIFVWIIELPLPSPQLKPAQISEAQKLAFSSAIDLVKLVITWTVTLIGATAYVYRAQFRDHQLRWHHAAALTITVLPSLASLYFAYLALDRAVLLLSLERISVQDDGLYLAVRWQYYLFLTALTGFTVVAIGTFNDFQINTTPPESEKKSKK